MDKGRKQDKVALWNLW